LEWLAAQLLAERPRDIVKFTRYFESMLERPDRRTIRLEWIDKVVSEPEREVIQADGRIRRWARIEPAGGKYLRVVLLQDGETVHNAFFDRTYTP
jgi:LEA14-like dessication related protein